MNFTATCCETLFDADGMASHLKGEHPRGITYEVKKEHDWHPGVSYTSATLRGGTVRVPARLPGVTLTKVETEWLGMTVELPDGRVGQVWSLVGKGHRQVPLYADHPTGAMRTVVFTPTTAAGDPADLAVAVDGELVLTRRDKARKIASWRKAAEEPALFAA